MVQDRLTVAYRLILGLSADPIHMGHIEMLSQAYQCLRDRGYRIAGALLIPVYRRNPVGASKERLPETFHHRCIMCQLAARYINRRLALPKGSFAVSSIEAELARGREAPNYTAETLSLLKARSEPGAELVFLISSELVSGVDPQFGHWYQVDTILNVAALTICPRPGYALNNDFVGSLVERGAHVIVLPEVETPDISATDLRNQMRAGVSPQTLEQQGLLIPSVARYLARHSLYGPGGTVAC